MERMEKYSGLEDGLGKIKKGTRGKLTVFLGAAAGVGKTYKMLQTAEERVREGVVVVIGWVEIHGRSDTEKLVDGFERILPKEVIYQGKRMREFDIDTILAQKPELVLVDELAHSNIHGSRHTRRFQDVEEILQAGIDVYTTVNIQHIESLNDIVAQITGVVVRETVPDYIVEQADHIQLIDILPEELIKRLQEGKIYSHGQSKDALEKFFRLGNITALRELALRFTASRVDEAMASYMREKEIAGPWPAAGRVMVCVSASPFSTQLIRAARQLASGLQADFLAVHIETAERRFPLGDKERERISRNLRLAEELGGKTLTVVGGDLVQEILEVARTHNVTAIVVGKAGQRNWWSFWRRSVLESLIRRSGGINVYAIQSSEEKEESPSIMTARSAANFSKWGHFAGGFTMTLLVTAIGFLGQEKLELVNVALLYLLPVLLTAVWWGRWPSYFTAVCSMMLFDFFFVPPIFKLSVYDIRHIWSFGIFLVVSFLIGGRTELLKLEASMARQREKSVRSLYQFSREIAGVIDLDKIYSELSKQIGESIGRKVLVLCPNNEGQLEECGRHTGKEKVSKSLSVSEYGVASWSLKNGRAAGHTTETLPGSENLYIPLRAGAAVIGVLGIEIGMQPLSPEERRLIETWASLAAMAVERVNLVQEAQKAALLVESDKLRTAIFNSISHELRTPLATIIGAASSLADREMTLSEQARLELLETVLDGSLRMERIVINLLDTARQETGRLSLKIDWCELEDLVGTALQQIQRIKENHPILTQLPDGLALFRGDFVLLEQVLVNLLDNAMKYSTLGTPITIRAKSEGDNLVVSVIDQGSGLAEEDKIRIFEKFYRASQKNKIAGIGLGLSICKGIIEAHKGRIWAENQPEGGTKISFCIPLSNETAKFSVEEGDYNG